MVIKVRCQNCRDLAAYWQFEDTVEFDESGASKLRLVAKDSSGNGNHLPLVTPPAAADVLIQNDVRTAPALFRELHLFRCCLRPFVVAHQQQHTACLSLKIAVSYAGLLQ